MPLVGDHPFGRVVPLVVNADDPADLPAHDARLLEPLYSCDERGLVKAFSSMMIKGKVGVAMLLRAIEAGEFNKAVDPFVDAYDGDLTPDFSGVPDNLWKGRCTVTCLNKRSSATEATFDVLAVEGDPRRTSEAWAVGTVECVTGRVNFKVHDGNDGHNMAELVFSNRQDPYSEDNIDYTSETTYTFVPGTPGMPGCVSVKEMRCSATTHRPVRQVLRADWYGDGTLDVIPMSPILHGMRGPTKRLQYYRIEMAKQPVRWAERFRSVFEAWVSRARHELFKPDSTGYKRAREEFEGLQ